MTNKYQMMNSKMTMLRILKGLKLVFVFLETVPVNQQSYHLLAISYIREHWNTRPDVVMVYTRGVNLKYKMGTEQLPILKEVVLN